MIGWGDLKASVKSSMDIIGVPATVVILAFVFLSMGWVPFSTTASNVQELSISLRQHNAIMEAQGQALREQQSQTFAVLKAICFNTAVYDKALIRECSKL